MKIPIRSMITAPKGKLLLSVDLSQAEAWVVAYLANEPTMKEALLHGDIHTKTALFVLDLPSHWTKKDIPDEKRYVGKKCNHAFNYRMGPGRAAEVINKEGIITVTIKQTKKFHEKYLQLYNLRGWWLEIEEKLKLYHTLTTPYGFTRRFYQSIGDELFKEATAFIPQSTIADHMYGAIQDEVGIPGGLKVVNEKIIQPNPELSMIQSAHDSAIIEFPESIDVKELSEEVLSILKRPMIINGEEFTIPADAKYGPRWEEFQKV